MSKTLGDLTRSDFYRVTNTQAEVLDRGIIRAVVSDDGIDKHGTILDPEGADWSEFMLNGGPVLANHGLENGGRGNLPIGNVQQLERKTIHGRRSILATIKFWDDDEYAESIAKRYKNATMRGWSVRGVPKDFSRPTREEQRARPEWNEAQMVFRQWTLVEVSATSTPSNGRCLTMVERSAPKFNEIRGIAGAGSTYYRSPWTKLWTVHGRIPLKDKHGEIYGYSFGEIARTDNESLAKLMCEQKD
jgi:hypothetical protein